MAATVFFAGSSEVAKLANTFSISGTPSDPTTVSCVITDPNGAATTHTFGGMAPADITQTATGAYQLLVPCTIVGLWSFVWIGTGTASDIQPGTWTVNPVNLSQFYCSVEELKDRLSITDSGSDLTLQMAVQSAARWIEGHCGRYFYQATDTRTYIPYDIYSQPLDDLVSVSSFKIDRDGDGVFEETWTQGTDYELAFNLTEFNQLSSGEARPYTMARVTNAGRLFPFVYPLSRLDRIQVTGMFGWPAVPYAVKQAALQVAADFFKLKDAPFGLAGSPEFGMMRVQPATGVWELLTPYIHSRRKIGV